MESADWAGLGINGIAAFAWALLMIHERPRVPVVLGGIMFAVHSAFFLLYCIKAW